MLRKRKYDNSKNSQLDCVSLKYLAWITGMAKDTLQFKSVFLLSRDNGYCLAKSLRLLDLNAELFAVLGRRLQLFDTAVGMRSRIG